MKNQSIYIIAEAGVNHNGDLNLALQLIDVAVEAGANAIKFQTFSAEQLVSAIAPKADYQKNRTNVSESQLQMLKKLELSQSNHFVLKTHCEKKRIDFLSTPFDSMSANFLLNQLNLKTIKIASGEIASAPLLLQIARFQPTIILSTGMSTLGDIEEALGVLAFGFLNSTGKPCKKSFIQAYCSAEGQKVLKQKVILLHCTSAYPASVYHTNLYVMDTLKLAFNLPVGYSDHSVGITVPIAAVARGATIIEKHFTLDRHLPGPDHQASLEPDELKKMVQSIREVECALGNSIKAPTPQELDIKLVARKSLTAIKKISIGEKFNQNNMSVKRPGTGIAPVYYWDYLERSAMRHYVTDELISE